MAGESESSAKSGLRYFEDSFDLEEYASATTNLNENKPKKYGSFIREKGNRKKRWRKIVTFSAILVIVIIIILSIVSFDFIGYIYKITKTEESRFVGTWKNEKSGTLIFYSDGTIVLGIIEGTYELKDGKLVIRALSGEVNLVSVYDYYFSENDTKLNLIDINSGITTTYTKQ